MKKLLIITIAALILLSAGWGRDKWGAKPHGFDKYGSGQYGSGGEVTPPVTVSVLKEDGTNATKEDGTNWLKE